MRTFSAVTGDSASVVLRGKWGWWNHLRCLLHVQPHLLSPAALSCDLLLSAHRQLQFMVRTLYHIWQPLIIATYENNEKTKQALEDMFYKYLLSTYCTILTESILLIQATVWTLNVLMNGHILSQYLWRTLRIVNFRKQSFHWMVNTADLQFNQNFYQRITHYLLKGPWLGSITIIDLLLRLINLDWYRSLVRKLTTWRPSTSFKNARKGKSWTMWFMVLFPNSNISWTIIFIPHFQLTVHSRSHTSLETNPQVHFLRGRYKQGHKLAPY